eukprot:CAMPEP_0203848166 /NCGR_PEP_ID=MMETSP0359-20131031/5437_1 /ASSEMBLY_ACC=CAM_ASM_000338 /TAXON_ID=268821 /ORGANISM="Scrippsiella Hangoei, Strain SHTV-5" /LENGTH=185 /DNA_ID=CAMNT_0050763723 /DNA_START=402 /DNA_END=954 /DNA_ORIENTATION=-
MFITSGPHSHWNDMSGSCMSVYAATAHCNSNEKCSGVLNSFEKSQHCNCDANIKSKAGDDDTINPSVLIETVTPCNPLSTMASLSLDPRQELISSAELSAAMPTSVGANVGNLVDVPVVRAAAAMLRADADAAAEWGGHLVIVHEVADDREAQDDDFRHHSAILNAQSAAEHARAHHVLERVHQA